MPMSYGPPPNPQNSYDNSNNIPINNYNPQGSHGHPSTDYYDEGQPNEIYSAASSTNKATEPLKKIKK